MRHGLTLIETLLSLALLSGVTIAGTTWLQTSVRTSESVADTARWLASAEALLRCIGDDLACRDLPAQSNSSRQPPSRVATDAHTLTIHTRRAMHPEPGSRTSASTQPQWVYRYDAESQAVFLITPDAATSPQSSDAPLLGDTAEARFTISDDGRLLSVYLASTHASAASRSYRLTEDE